MPVHRRPGALSASAALSLALLAAVSIAACGPGTLPPGSGPNQQTLAQWGATLRGALTTAETIHTAAALACRPPAPGQPAILDRPTCLKVDLAGAALQAAINEAGRALDARISGQPVDPTALIARVSVGLVNLLTAAREAGVRW